MILAAGDLYKGRHRRLAKFFAAGADPDREGRQVRGDGKDIDLIGKRAGVEDQPGDHPDPAAHPDHGDDRLVAGDLRVDIGADVFGCKPLFNPIAAETAFGDDDWCFSPIDSPGGADDRGGEAMWTDENQGNFGQFNKNKAFRQPLGPGGDNDIGIATGQFEQGSGGITGLEVDMDLGMGGTELIEDLGEQAEEGGDRTVEGEFATEDLVGGQFGVQFGPVVEGLFGIFFENLPGLGQTDRPLVAVEKVAAQLLFQALHRPGQTGRGDIAVLTGPTEMEAAGEMAEKFEFLDIHRSLGGAGRG